MIHLGRILEVDLGTGHWAFSRYPQEVCEQFLGGRGFNARLLYREIPAGIEPLGPENVLLFSCGLLTGTPAPASSRVHVNALSPLTRILGSANFGGNFGTELRCCDIQSVIIRGQAQKPVYLFINEDHVEIRGARFLWGADTWQTIKRIKAKLGDEDLKIIAIGPAGENRTSFACIMADRDHAAGRTGMGAVMGSKNLKAVVVKGPARNETAAYRKNRHRAVKQYLKRIVSSPEYKTLSRFGGAGYVKWADDMGLLATHNYRDNRFDQVDRLDGRQLRKFVARSSYCHRCPVGCKADLQINSTKQQQSQVVRPEFESMVSLGPKCGLSDLSTLVYLDNLCSRMGLDCISAGGAISFAMDLYDHGILTQADTGGMDLSWGNGEAMEALICQMADRVGFGAVLSQGVRNAGEIIGRGSQQCAFHVKGLELSAFHPSQIMGTALGYAVANRGGDFNDVYANLEYRVSSQNPAEQMKGTPAVDLRTTIGKAPLVRKAMIASAIVDSLGLCKVPSLSILGSFDLTSEAELTSALTGLSMDPKQFIKIGERIINLERLFNLRHGVTFEDDCLPQRFFITKGTAAEKPMDNKNWLEPMKQEFYQAMGWDKRGRPSQEKLDELNL